MYTMWIEKPAFEVRQHGFHLGTILEVAERIVLEAMKADPEIVTICLREDGKVVRIFDSYDLMELENWCAACLGDSYTR